MKCGGAERGTCDCGFCTCKDGWSGEFCDCRTSKATCIAPNGTEVCSGNGECKCGTCECNENIMGTFCEISSLKENRLCGYYDQCVRCLILGQNNCTENGCSSETNSTFDFEIVKEIPISNISCIVRINDEEGRPCEHRFTYKVDAQQQSYLKVFINSCQYINVGATGAIIVVATFLLGCFILVAIKTWNSVQDKREFARFETERQNQTTYQFESPLYNSPNRRYEVPPELFAEDRDMEMKSLN